MDAHVRLERDGDVAVTVNDNPPINAGSTDVRRGLLAAVQQVGQDPTLPAAVPIGAGNTFIAGSDVRAFGQPLAEPQRPTVIAAIEACTQPFVAALHGAALGGAQGVPVLRNLGLPDTEARVNPNGGAIAPGHPLGASGARPATTAMNQRHAGAGRSALATMCIGVDQGTAMVLERV